MRRFFRLLGVVRFAVGVAIVISAFLFRNELGEIWTGVLVLAGAAVGVSGVTTAFLYIVYCLVVSFGYIGIKWLISDIWRGAWYSDVLRDNYGVLYFIWAGGLIAFPAIFYYHNKSWFFMARHFSLDEAPADTPHPELFAWGTVDITGSPYLAAATITEQGLILDRRNFDPVILPWRWVTSVKPDEEADPRAPSAVVAMRNNDGEYLTLTIPWNKELLELNTSRLAEPDT